MIPQSKPYAMAAAAAGVLAVSALLNRYLAAKAERNDPPAGHFLDVDGVRLHYVERGRGEALVLLHGNGSMIQDFESSGLIEMAARNIASLFLTVLATAIAIVLAPGSGRQGPKPTLSIKRWGS